MNVKELRSKTVEELRTEIFELNKALFSLRIQFYTQQMTNSSQFRKLRKDIARAKTILSEKTRGL